jgi:hypothetical protein
MGVFDSFITWDPKERLLLIAGMAVITYLQLSLINDKCLQFALITAKRTSSCFPATGKQQVEKAFPPHPFHFPKFLFAN